MRKMPKTNKQQIAKNQLNTILSEVIDKIVKKKIEGVVMMQLDGMIDNQIEDKVREVDFDETVSDWMDENFSRVIRGTKFDKSLQKAVNRIAKDKIESQIDEWVDMSEVDEVINDTVVKFVHNRMQTQLRKSIDGKIARLTQSIKMGVWKDNDMQPKLPTKKAKKNDKK